MTYEEAKKLIMIEVANYTGFFKDRTPEMAKLQIETWASLFANESFEDVSAALGEAMKECTFPPTIGDVCKQLRAKRAKALPNEGEMWEITRKLERQMRNNKERAANGGYYDKDGRHTSKELIEENQRLFNSLPPAVQEWAGSASGLLDVFDRNDSDIAAFVRPAFKKAIEAARADQVKDIEQLPPAERPRLTE